MRLGCCKCDLASVLKPPKVLKLTAASTRSLRLRSVVAEGARSCWRASQAKRRYTRLCIGSFPCMLEDSTVADTLCRSTSELETASAWQLNGSELEAVGCESARDSALACGPELGQAPPTSTFSMREWMKPPTILEPATARHRTSAQKLWGVHGNEE